MIRGSYRREEKEIFTCGTYLCTLLLLTDSMSACLTPCSKALHGACVGKGRGEGDNRHIWHVNSPPLSWLAAAAAHWTAGVGGQLGLGGAAVVVGQLGLGGADGVGGGADGAGRGCSGGGPAGAGRDSCFGGPDGAGRDSWCTEFCWQLKWQM